MIYQTFCVIFDYLLESGKIAQDREGWIVWIWNPELVKKYLDKQNKGLIEKYLTGKKKSIKLVQL